MDEEPVSETEQEAAGFWTALAEDDDEEVEAWLADAAIEQVGEGEGIAQRVRDLLGLGPRECANVAVLRDVALKGVVDIGDLDDAHRIEYMVADLVDDVNDERLVADEGAAMASTWTLEVMKTEDEWFVDWEERR